ncbi:hypothetical protein FEM48_Zijuj01G0088100 [Ziziphus jujuba var. spinosa]|uniref:ATP-dependent DNA helicase n=1 Tax=Ziziphus jujuba var. spinosa TaxID=714518 RepID=A0A978W0A3_ZIZJJ|nr:hypothetical protein FEM48_Zijuj01G0088100 [Ziziphus jujuba var. spinosa]
MFSAWMNANKKYVEARELTCAEFPTRFVWKSSEREWHPRKHGFAIERMFFVPARCGDMYYLRILLNTIWGPRNFKEIMNINGIQYNSLRDAYYALGLLDDDKEYVDGVKPGIFFAYGYVGTGKNFIWKTLLAALRSKGKIVLTVASSGIAFLLLPGVLKLTKNMRLQSIDSDIDKDELKAFSEWISSIGDGTIGGPNDGHAMIDIPNDLLIKYTEDSAASIVNSTYPSFSENINDPSYLQERAILAPTLDIVESINDYVSSLNQAEENTYLSSDATCKSDSNINLIGDLHTPEFLNAIKCSEVPNHQLKLKVGVPVLLLRNVDHYSGLCNGLDWSLQGLAIMFSKEKLFQEAIPGLTFLFQE